MKKKITIIIVLIALFLSMGTVNVYAGGADSEGDSSSAEGGSGEGGTTSGLAMMVNTLMRVTLVDVSGSNPVILAETYFKDKMNPTYVDDYFVNKNTSGGVAGANRICVGNFYAPGKSSCYSINSSDIDAVSIGDGKWFSTSSILTNFSQSKVKSKFCSSSSGAGNCVFSDDFQKLAKHLLDKASIISSGTSYNLQTLDGLDAAMQERLKKVRIIVEPVYAYHVQSTDKYAFFTIKGIGEYVTGHFSTPSDPCVGVSISSLFGNNNATLTHGSINSAPYSTSTTYQKYQALADTNNGHGYSVYYVIPCEGEECAPPTNSCVKQDGNYICRDGNVCTFDRFIDESECGCALVDVISLNSSQLTSYNNKCSLVPTETFTSSLNHCSTESTMGENTITHEYKKLVNSGNTYCSISCKEEIKTKSFTDVFSTMAGKYFELASYPTLTSSKSCEVEVSHKKWKTDYVNLLNDQLKAVNKKMKDYAVDHGIYDTRTITCSCGEECTTSGTRYYYRYNKYKYNSSSNTITSEVETNSYITGNCGNDKPSINTPEENDLIIGTKKTALNNHFTKLKDCNKHLNNLGSSYYIFNGDLHFYYEQTYSSIEEGGVISYNVLRRNDNKPDGEDDDSRFKITPKSDEGYINGYKEDNTTNYRDTSYINDTYGYASVGSVGNTSITTSEENIGSYVSANTYKINRIRNYASSYNPSIKKYTEPLTGIISSVSTSLVSPIELGEVYDTSVFAVAKTDNIDYYEFKTLGDNNEIAIAASTDSSISLKRYCEYEIKNDVICEDLEMCINYRMVDSNRIDPNNRLIDSSNNIVAYEINPSGISNGFKNWRNIKGQKTKEKIETEDTFNPSNLEYSFKLDSKAIKTIRDFTNGCDLGVCDELNARDYNNITHPYLKLQCNERGNECISAFITELNKDSGYFGSKIATNIDGRKKWSYLIHDETYNTWEIKVFDKDELDIATFDSLKTRYGSLGYDFLP